MVLFVKAKLYLFIFVCIHTYFTASKEVNFGFIVQKILPTDGSQRGFGSSVSISEDFAVIGSPYDSTNITYRGSVYIYKYNKISQAWEEKQ